MFSSIFGKKEEPKTMYWDHFSQVDPDEWRWENFSPEEMASRTVVNGERGPKGPLLINIRALDMLQELRYGWGSPLYANSAYRYPEYNELVGGVKDSEHLRATAYDIAMGPTLRERFIDMALEVGFKGIGRYNSFVHVDARIQNYVSYWDRR